MEESPSGTYPRISYNRGRKDRKYLSFTKTGKGCWVSWKKPSSNGYPYMWFNKKQITVARYVYITIFGEIAKGQMLRHRCDNKRCINPKHMVLGLPKDNARDAMERGLTPKGANHGMSKITPADTRAMMILSRAGYAGSYIARLFGVNKTTASKVLRGNHWSLKQKGKT